MVSFPFFSLPTFQGEQTIEYEQLRIISTKFPCLYEM